MFTFHGGVILALIATVAIFSEPSTAGTIINPGTNYEVNTDDIITYSQLGDCCDPAVQNDINRKTGICRATLICNPKTNLCDCEDIGPYQYTAENGKCKNIVGSYCYSTTDCVANAFCKHIPEERTIAKSRRICVCPVGSSCQGAKVPVARRL